jgi:iron complex outermembrane receptor protein
VRVIYEYEELSQPARPAIGIVSLPPSPGLPPFPVVPGAWISPFGAPVLNDAVNAHESRAFTGSDLQGLRGA